MGLDIYVGTLTRYHTGLWNTIVQQAGQPARDDGDHILRTLSGEGREIVERVSQDVVAWRAGLAAALQGQLAAPLEWAEGLTPPYFTDQVGWAGLIALQVWAAHNDHTDLPLPEDSVEDPSDDEAYVRSTEDLSQTHSPQILFPELWLPFTPPFVFCAETLPAQRTTLGSTHGLLLELQTLNAQTWQADEREIAEWRREGLSGDDFEVDARFGFAVSLTLVREAVAQGLVVKLDY